MTRDLAVSTGVGAILVLALVTGMITLYQLTIVPDLKEEAEAQHMDQVAQGMSDVDANILWQLRNRSHAPLSTPVPVTATTPVFVPNPSDSGSVSFAANDHDVTIASPSLKIVTRNGSTVFSGGLGTTSSWNTIQDGETVQAVDGVLGFRIRLTDAAPTDQDQLIVQATDADGNFAGDLSIRVDVDGQELHLIVRTREPPAPGTVVFHNHVLNMRLGHWDADYTIDALFDLYEFDSQLEQAGKPLTLTFEHNGLDAEFKIAHRERISSGLSVIRGDGQTISSFERGFGTGTLTYEAQNEYYPDQSLVIEHGALVREQSEGSAFVTDPPWNVEAAGGLARVGLDVPSLTGDTDTVSASGIANVRTLTESREALGASAGELDVTWGTDSPALWSSWLEDELTDAGLTSSNCPPTSPDSPCQFEIQTTDNTVTLELHGPTATDADPDNPTRDLFLNLQRAKIDTEVQQ